MKPPVERKGGGMPTEKNKALVRRYYDDLGNRWELPRAGSLGPAARHPASGEPPNDATVEAVEGNPVAARPFRSGGGEDAASCWDRILHQSIPKRRRVSDVVFQVPHRPDRLQVEVPNLPPNVIVLRFVKVAAGRRAAGEGRPVYERLKRPPLVTSLEERESHAPFNAEVPGEVEKGGGADLQTDGVRLHVLPLAVGVGGNGLEGLILLVGGYPKPGQPLHGELLTGVHGADVIKICDCGLDPRSRFEGGIGDIHRPVVAVPENRRDDGASERP